MIHANKTHDYYAGARAGILQYAINKDGTLHVGCGITKYADAIKETYMLEYQSYRSEFGSPMRRIAILSAHCHDESKLQFLFNLSDSELLEWAISNKPKETANA